MKTRWTFILALFLLLGTGFAQQETPSVPAQANRLLQAGKPLPAFLLLHVEDPDLARRLRTAQFDRYLDGTRTLSAVRNRWNRDQHDLPVEEATRLRRAFQELTSDLLSRYRGRSPLRIVTVGRDVHAAIVDPARDIPLQAFLASVRAVGSSTEIPAEERLELVTRLVIERAGATTEAAGVAVLGDRALLKGKSADPERLALLRTALEAAGFEADYGILRGGATGVRVRSGDHFTFVKPDVMNSQTPILEAGVNGESLEIRIAGSLPTRKKPLSHRESVPDVVSARSTSLAETSVAKRWTEYPVGRRVLFLDPASGSVREGGVVEQVEGDRHRVKYDGDKVREVTRAELDLLNAFYEIPDGSIVKPADHFRRARELPRADVLIDAAQDPYLRAFEAEMDVLGRAASLPEETRLQLLVRSVRSWMTANLSGQTVKSVEQKFSSESRPARLGEFMKVGEGVCRHLALLGQRGLQRMGFHSRYASAYGHANTNVLLSDGEWRKVDPYMNTVMKETSTKVPEGYLTEIRVGDQTLYQKFGGRPEGIPTPEFDLEERSLESLWERMYSGGFRHAEDWNPERFGRVPVRPVPTELVWFNPAATIQELEVRAGTPLAPEQKAALEKLLGVERSPTESGGTAAHPANVGRAFNPSPGALTITIGDGHHQGLDLTAKGTRNNKVGPNPRGDGTLELSEAMLDAEISLRLQEAGVRNYLPVAVLRRVDDPSKAIYWRMPTYSLVRADDLVDKLLSPEEALKTVERIASDASRFEGKSIGVREFLQEHYPRQMGENAGRLRGLGVIHGTIQWAGYGNSGIGETVDWGAGMRPEFSTELTDNPEHSKFGENRESFLRDVDKVLERMNEVLTEKVSIEEAHRQYQEGYEYGRRAIEQSGAEVWLRREVVEQIGDTDLRNLLRGFGDPKAATAKRSQLLKMLDDRGLLRDGGSLEVQRRGPTWVRKTGRFAAGEAKGAAKFAAAYLLKEGMVALEHWDGERWDDAGQHLKTGEFWTSFAVFSVASRAVERGLGMEVVSKSFPRLVRGMTRATAPLAAGMLAVQLSSGNYHPGDLALSTAAYASSGLLLNLIMTATPANRVKAAFVTLGKLTLTLFVGEKLERLYRGWFGIGETTSSISRRRGISGTLRTLERSVPEPHRDPE